MIVNELLSLSGYQSYPVKPNAAMISGWVEFYLYFAVLVSVIGYFSVLFFRDYR